MPEGQFTGSRAKYEYEADDGTLYKLNLDATLGSVTDNGLAFLPATSTAIPKPTGFRPRVVFWQGELNGVIKRKEIVCNPAGALYATDKSTALTIDGVAGNTTGRRGEKLTF